jgi:two-component system cell cycle sensor histidine kinase/response regulator CckA
MAPSFPPAYRRGAVVLVFLLGVTLSIVTWRYVERQEKERVRVGFLSRAQTQATAAGQHLRSYAEMVHSLRDSFLGQQEVTRREFATVARSLLARHPGVQALQWVDILPHAERAAFEARATRELGRPVVIRQRQPDNSLAVAPPGGEYFVITYVEPIAGNEAVMGYDVRTAPTAPLLDAARQDHQFKVSATLQLAQSVPGQTEPGVIFLLPLWREEAPGQPVEGFVQGVFLVHTMLAQSHSLTTSDALDTFYYDTTAGGEPVPLYTNLGGRSFPPGAGTGPAPPAIDDPDTVRATLPVGNRTWQMVIRPNADWARANTSRQPVVLLLAGLTVTVLFTGFVNNLFTRGAIIEQEVRERTRQLRASEARLQDILDHSPAIIFVKDLDGRYLICNEAFARFCGRTPGDIVGRRDEELFPPDAARLAREHDAAVLQAGAPREFEETTLNTADPRAYLAHKFPLVDDEGRAYALCGIATDITDRKSAETHRLSLERNLLEAQKLESLGMLAGGVAHDFNNILTSILGNASLAGLDLGDDHPARRSITQIERAAHRAADLCAQLLAYAGRASFVSKPLDLSALVRETTELLEVSIGKRGHLELALGSGLPSVVGDPTQLRQVVMNLVLNAADALGGRADGRVLVRTFSRQMAEGDFRTAVRAPALRAGLYAGLEVADNGCGMPADVLARIFEPFFTTKFSGRGLGLAAVLGIVQRHEGALFVDTQPRQGTTFRLLFPTSALAATGSGTPFEVGEHPLRGTVLVVDDEEPVRAVTRHALTAFGLQAIIAPDGVSALELLGSGTGDSVDLVLLDLTMPGLAGDETLRRLRQIRPDLRVIIMSGYSEGETMQRCAALGVVDYLPKPFDVSVLKRKLQPHLG